MCSMVWTQPWKFVINKCVYSKIKEEKQDGTHLWLTSKVFILGFMTLCIFEQWCLQMIFFTHLLRLEQIVNPCLASMCHFYVIFLSWMHHHCVGVEEVICSNDCVILDGNESEQTRHLQKKSDLFTRPLCQCVTCYSSIGWCAVPYFDNTRYLKLLCFVY